MRKIVLFALGFCLMLGCAAGRASASQAAQAAQAPASAQAAQPADKTQPSYDMKAQSIFDLQDLQKKYVDLAGAIPAEKYTWRPAEGVRSFSELFLHISGANYNIPHLMEVPLPAGFDPKTFEKSTTDKAKIIEQLNKSFAASIAVVQKMTNADFAKPEKKLGPDANDGDVVYILVTHAHEHLGQSIAYARVNGIVPPWTAEALKKSAQKPQD